MSLQETVYYWILFFHNRLSVGGHFLMIKKLFIYLSYAAALFLILFLKI